MISSIDEIAKHPIVFVLYRSGSSGEFFAHAITQSFDSITSTQYYWKTSSRMEHEDCFKHILKSGIANVDINDIIVKFNEYMAVYEPVATAHLATVHPKGNSLEIITKYFSHCPIIEIVTFNDSSKKFLKIAVTSKLPGHPLDTLNSNCCDYHCEKHLLVEWSDIIFDTRKVFDQLQNFLSMTGDYNKFCLLVDDYKLRNQTLLDQL
jgi:hypothetical protein